ncbi:DUF2012 domain-containing protein, partial [bacterium]|nr:DUF2012 domain-containing protein [bacterium]
VIVPVTLDDITNHDIVGFLATIHFNHDILTPLGVDFDSTVVEPWAAVFEDLPGGLFPFTRIDSQGIFKLTLMGADAIPEPGLLFKLIFLATGNSGTTSPLTFQEFTLYDLDGSNPIPTLLDGSVYIAYPKLNIIITTNIPELSKVMVDGQEQPTPYRTQWEYGSNHTVGVNSPQNLFVNTRMYFRTWSDDGTQTHTVTPVTDAIYTAQMGMEYFVDVQSEYGTTTGSGWYQAATTASISVDSQINPEDGVRYVFSGWEGNGTGSYTGSDNAVEFAVNGPISEQAIWRTEYEITTKSRPEGIAAIAGEGWYAEGSTALLTAPATAAEKNFQNWILGTVRMVDNPLELQVVAPQEIVANYLDLKLIEINTTPGENGRMIVDDDTVLTPIQFEWEEETIHTIEALPVQFLTDSTRNIFSQWNNAGDRAQTLTITNDLILTAEYEQEVHVVVNTAPADLYDLAGTGWYALGDTVMFGPIEKVVEQDGRQYTFDHWAWRGYMLYTPQIISIIDGPQTLTAHYSFGYFIQGTLLVTDRTIPDARLILSGPKTDTTMTDAQGAFLFEHLPEGTYTLHAEKAGFEFPPLPIVILSAIGSYQNLHYSGLDVTPPLVELLNPKGGEIFPAETTVEIRWQANDNMGIDSLALNYSIDGGTTWQPVAEITVDDTLFVWNLPNISSTKCLVQIWAVDDGQNSSSAQNASFFVIDNGT